MANQTTGRTSQILLRVRPEIKADINRMSKLGFNVADAFEQWYLRNYLGKQYLQEKKKELENHLSLIDERLKKVEDKERKEVRLSLSAGDISKLKRAIEFKQLNSQYSAFVTICSEEKKDISLDEFKKLKQKYIRKTN